MMLWGLTRCVDRGGKRQAAQTADRKHHRPKRSQPGFTAGAAPDSVHCAGEADWTTLQCCSMHAQPRLTPPKADFDGWVSVSALPHEGG